MRRVAHAGLLVLVGCNGILGIEATRQFDAGPDVTPEAPPHVELVWQVASVAETGEAYPLISFKPITDHMRVRIATRDGEFQSGVYTDEGWVLVPLSYMNAETGWRLEYTLAGVTHEVQWKPAAGRGRITVPVFGRIDGDALPTGSGYTTTPAGAPAAYTFPRMLTTGLWTEGLVDASTAPRVDFDLFNALALSGSKFRPDPALGDRALLVDYENQGQCRRAVGSAALASSEVVAGSHSEVASTWDSAMKGLEVPAVAVQFLARLEALGNLGGPTIQGTQLFGRLASLGMPALSESGPLRSPTTLLPVPMMHTLLQCPFDKPAQSVARPMLLESFPPALHIQIYQTRMVGPLALTSGLEAVMTTGDLGDILSFNIQFPAALPTEMKLLTPDGLTLDLSGQADHLPAGLPTGRFTLTFKPDNAPGTRNDYYDVRLHRVDGDRTQLQRIYRVVTPTVLIDAAVLAPATEYVLEIRSYKGHMLAAQGDFAPIDFPYGSGVVFTRTFQTAP